MNMLLIFFLLSTKHFLVDFPLQNKFQWSNKGTYGHPGGIFHAWLHGVSTWLIIAAVVGTPYAFLFGLADAIIHYHVDWAKMNLNKKFGWGPTTHDEFWWLVGLDQYLHVLTYIGLTYLVDVV